MGEAKKKLTSEKAWKAWMQFKKPTFSATAKFTNDHVLPKSRQLSKKNAIDAAVDRYKKNSRITSSTWNAAKPGDLAAAANKLGSKAWKATTFRGEQQLAVLVEVSSITVELELLTSQEYEALKRNLKKNCRALDPQKRNSKWLHATTKEHPEKFCIMGKWDPFQGTAELHHYAPVASFPSNHSFDEKYLVWWCECVGNKFVKPLKFIRPEKKS